MFSLIFYDNQMYAIWTYNKCFHSYFMTIKCMQYEHTTNVFTLNCNSKAWNQDIRLSAGPVCVSGTLSQLRGSTSAGPTSGLLRSCCDQSLQHASHKYQLLNQTRIMTNSMGFLSLKVSIIGGPYSEWVLIPVMGLFIFKCHYK